MKRIIITLFVLLTLGLIPASIGLARTAQASDDNEVEFTGVIESQNGDLWTIGGQEVTVNSSTTIDESKGPAVVGAVVEVKAVEQADGSLLAIRIRVEDTNETPTPGGTKTPEPTSTHESTKTPKPTKTPEPTETAEPTETPELTETPEPTETIEPSETPELTETPEATETIEPTETPESTKTPSASPTPGGAEAEFRGRIESISETAWVIGGRTVLLNSSTIIDTREGPARIGATAKVNARQDAAGNLYARRIRVLNRIPDGHKVEFRGAIESISPTQWVVAQQTLIVDDGTVFTNLERAKVGAIAEVKARRTEGNQLLAIAIHIEGNESELKNEVEFSGQLLSFTAEAWVIGGQTVLIGPETVIEGNPSVGANVEVHALIQPDDSLLATELHVEDAEAEVEFTGIVTSISADSWVIGEQTVLVDGRTAIDERRGPVGIGAKVEVKALRAADGSLIALRIKVED